MKIIKGTITTVAMIANLLFACMLIVASYASWVPPTLFRIPALFGLVFPIVLFCNLFFLFFWAFYRWRYIWVQLFTFLICAPAIWRYMPLNFTDENDTGAPGFTLVSYNAYNFLDQGRRVYDRNRTVQYSGIGSRCGVLAGGFGYSGKGNGPVEGFVGAGSPSAPTLPVSAYLRNPVGGVFEISDPDCLEEIVFGKQRCVCLPADGGRASADDRQLPFGVDRTDDYRQGIVSEYDGFSTKRDVE